jgi:hypothetical protein
MTVSFENMGRKIGGHHFPSEFEQGQDDSILSEHEQGNRWASVPIRVSHRNRLTESHRTGQGNRRASVPIRVSQRDRLAESCQNKGRVTSGHQFPSEF